MVVLRGYVRSNLGTARGTELLEYIGMYSMIFYCVHSVELLVIPWDRRLVQMIPFLGGQQIWGKVIQTLLIYILRVALLLAVTALINSLRKKVYHFRTKRNR